MGTLRVIDGGLLTTVQDATGRLGLARLGVPVGGAADAGAARLANRLVGTAETAAVLELTLVGPTLELEAPAHVAVAGADLDLRTDLGRLRPGHSIRLPAGTVIRGGLARNGARGYLAVQGGFLVPPVLGSSATDRRSGFGGLEGRELRPGDRLDFEPDQDGPARSVVGSAPPDDGPIRIVPTPASFGWFDEWATRSLVAGSWRVADDADRTGIRLVGSRIDAQTTGTASLGVPVGAIQVPPSGEPIVTMVDGPVTGGYPILAVVARVDRDRLAQLAPGADIRFASVTVGDARALEAATSPARIEIDPGDLGAAWAG